MAAPVESRALFILRIFVDENLSQIGFNLEVLIKNDLVKGSKKYQRKELYFLRASLVKAIDPLQSKGAALQEILLHCNSMAMGESSNEG